MIRFDPLSDQGIFMATLECLVNSTQSNNVALIFVHGLNGDARTTWMYDESDVKTLWPAWLAEDTGCAVWLLGYDAALSAWHSNAMPLPDQGDQVLDRLVTEPKLANSFLVLIGHSMGGLVIKTLINSGLTKGVERYEELIKRIIGIVFIATPHKGSDLANLAIFAKWILRTNAHVGNLKNHDEHLRTLHQQFLAFHKKNPIPIRTYAETRGFERKIFGINILPAKLVVDPDAAEPHVNGEIAIRLSEDHLSICKPKNREVQLYKSLLDYLKEYICITDNHQNKVTRSEKKLPMSHFSYTNRSIPVIVLVTVNDKETHAVFDVFVGKNQSPKTVTKANITYYNLGDHYGIKLIHTVCEMGSNAIGASQQRVSEAIEHWHPKAIISVGIAFGINEQKQKIGDVLVSTQLQDYELGRLNEDGTITPRGDKAHAADVLINRFRTINASKKRTEPDWPNVNFGLVLTGQKLLDNLNYRESLKKLHSEAIGGEMEGMGLYVSAQKEKVDWIIVKAVCDWGYNKNQKSKDEFQEIAALSATKFLKACLSEDGLYTSNPQPLPVNIDVKKNDNNKKKFNGKYLLIFASITIAIAFLTNFFPDILIRKSLDCSEFISMSKKNPLAIAGFVYDDKGTPILGAEVKLLEINSVKTSDNKGCFYFDDIKNEDATIQNFTYNAKLMSKELYANGYISLGDVKKNISLKPRTLDQR